MNGEASPTRNFTNCVYARNICPADSGPKIGLVYIRMNNVTPARKSVFFRTLKAVLGEGDKAANGGNVEEESRETIMQNSYLSKSKPKKNK